MNKLLIFGLIIGVVFTKLRENSHCVLANPDTPQDCFSQKTEHFQQTCCYFEGTYQDTDGKMKTGKSCLEAFKYDVSNGKRKAETQKKIEEGTYWTEYPDYPGIKDIESFVCFDEISECEKMQPAKGEDDCYNAHPELTSESCCYIESDWHKGDHHEDNIEKSCIDIFTEDVQTPEGLEETKERIKNGTYWPDGDYGYAKVINAFRCKKSTISQQEDPVASSSSLMVNLLVISLILFLF